MLQSQSRILSPNWVDFIWFGGHFRVFEMVLKRFTTAKLHGSLPSCLLKTDPRRKWRKTQSWLKRLVQCLPVGEVERTGLDTSETTRIEIHGEAQPAFLIVWWNLFFFLIFIIPYLLNCSNLVFLPHGAFHCWHNRRFWTGQHWQMHLCSSACSFAVDQFKIVGVCYFSTNFRQVIRCGFGFWFWNSRRGGTC